MIIEEENENIIEEEKEESSNYRIRQIILEYPSQTCSWIHEISNRDRTNIMIGTCEKSLKINSLYAFPIQLSSKWWQDLSYYKPPQLMLKINQRSGVHKSRQSLIQENLLACQTLLNEIDIFNYKNFTTNKVDPLIKPEIILKSNYKNNNNDRDIQCLNNFMWSPIKSGHIASPGINNNINIWDITDCTKNILKPIIEIVDLSSQIVDVAWNRVQENQFVSCSVEGEINMYLLINIKNNI